MRRGWRGMVLITVMWAVLVLGLLAWAVGRQASTQVFFVETYAGKMRSYAAARSAVNYTLDLLSSSPAAKHTLYQSGIKIADGKDAKDMFRLQVGDGVYAEIFRTKAGEEKTYGLTDEGGKVNINALNAGNGQVLAALLEGKGLSLSEAQRLAAAIVDFMDEDKSLLATAQGNVIGSEEKTKNKPLQHVEELLLVKGMSAAIFDKIKDEVTVWSDQDLSVNVNTASEPVLKAVGQLSPQNGQQSDMTAVVQKVLKDRNGPDSVPMTRDDGVAQQVDRSQWPLSWEDGTSSYFSARVVGVDEHSGRHSMVRVVFHHDPGAARASVADWQEQ